MKYNKKILTVTVTLLAIFLLVKAMQTILIGISMSEPGTLGSLIIWSHVVFYVGMLAATLLLINRSVAAISLALLSVALVVGVFVAFELKPIVFLLKSLPYLLSILFLSLATKFIPIEKVSGHDPT